MHYYDKGGRKKPQQQPFDPLPRPTTGGGANGIGGMNIGGQNPYRYDNGGNWTNLAQEMLQAAKGSFEKGVALGQINNVLQMQAKRKNRRFTKGGKF